MLKDLEWIETTSELRAPTDPGFAVMRGAFGGWTAAHAVVAAQRLAAREAAGADAATLSPLFPLFPLSLSIDYLRGVSEGMVSSRPSVVHATRSTQFIRVQTWSGEQLCANSSVVLARRRETDRLVSLPAPDAPAPETLAALPPMPLATTGPMPVTWIERYDMRPVDGRMFKNNPGMRSLMWSRLKQEHALDHAALAALVDANFPRIFFHYGAPSPIATVTMSVHFHAGPDDLAAVGSDFVLMEAFNRVARDGFFDQQVHIWSRAGVLLATSSQLVWFDVKP
jgi:acyl-coenzyme A thioesterase PaaI-like protein